MGVHDIEHYPRIRELLGIPVGEPIFILRAQDVTAEITLQTYILNNEIEGNDPSFMEDLRKVQNEFQNWAIHNPDRMKRADR